MDTFKIGLNFNTHIKLTHMDGDGHILCIQEGHNDFTYAAAGVLVTALLRSGPSQVTSLYARYGSSSGSNMGVLSPPTSGDIKTSTRATFVQNSGGGDPRGGLWIPLQLPPTVVTTNPSTYNGNQVTFSFRIPYNPSTTAGATFVASGSGTPSYIAAIGLAVSPNYGVDPTQDIIITAMQYTSFTPSQAFSIPQGGQTAVDYTFALYS